MEAPKNALVWVAGGRHYGDSERLFHVLDQYQARHGIHAIITGAAPGADSWAEAWARLREVAYIGVPARWETEGDAAGQKRNERIATEYQPDVLLAFPGGTGTDDAVEVAERHNIVVFRIS